MTAQLTQAVAVLAPILTLVVIIFCSAFACCCPGRRGAAEVGGVRASSDQEAPPAT